MLTPEDLELLEASLLPALERHYLRLLAHGLRTLQAIAASTPNSQRLPDRAKMDVWAASQASLVDDPAFREAFLDQLERLLDPLEAIASTVHQPPLALQIPHLVAWAKGQADRRLSSQGQPPG